MEFKEFYITDKNGKSNCVVRSLCKILNKEYEDVYNNLIILSKDLDCSFNDIIAFETYMKNNNIVKISKKNDIQIKNLKLDKGLYIVFCYNKNEYYHMIPIINNVIYDKSSDCMDLYVIEIYKKYGKTKVS